MQVKEIVWGLVNTNIYPTQEISTVMALFHSAGLGERSIVLLYCLLVPGMFKLINAQTLSDALLSVEQQQNKQALIRDGKPACVSPFLPLFIHHIKMADFIKTLVPTWKFVNVCVSLAFGCAVCK